MRQISRVLTISLLVAFGTTGCAKLSLRDVPMPSLVRGEKYEVTAVFRNVLGLPEQAAVKWGGATIGEVGAIRTVDYTARVKLQIGRQTSLPADTRAEIRFASPMGEAFIELHDPPGGKGTLGPGDVIPLASTSQAASVGDLLSVASTVINGGSFGDLKVIVDELNAALRGNSGNIRQMLRQVDGLLTRLNQHTAQFDAALDSAEQLSGSLAEDRDLLGQSLDAFEPAAKTLSRQADEIFALMSELRRLSKTATGTIKQTRHSMLSVLADLDPILQTLTDNERTFRATIAGIRAFAIATASAVFGLYLNYDQITILNEALLPQAPPPGGLP